MRKLGKREEVFGAETLTPLNINGKPAKFPGLSSDETVICGYDQGLGEELIVCDDLNDMTALYDGYCSGGALRIKWYKGKDVGFIVIL